jgi:rhodanese-related sulfurtransferase
MSVSFVTERLANKLQLCINMGIFSALFGKKESVDMGQLIKNGAIVIDVRTSGEYSTGHIKGSKNMPLDKLMSQISKVKKDQAIITCCASGMRSASAKGMLKKAGYENVHNGGSWSSLRKYFN